MLFSKKYAFDLGRVIYTFTSAQYMTVRAKDFLPNNHSTPRRSEKSFALTLEQHHIERWLSIPYHSIKQYKKFRQAKTPDTHFLSHVRGDF